MSIPANIVEGTAQKSSRQFARYLQISLGSTSELEYHLILVRDTAIISKSDFESLNSQVIGVRRMLYALMRKLSSTHSLSEGKPRTSGVVSP